MVVAEGEGDVTVHPNALVYLDLQFTIVREAGWGGGGGYHIEIADPCLVELGFRDGDIVRSIDGQALTGRRQFVDAMRGLRDRERFMVELTRGGQPQTLRYRIAPTKSAAPPAREPPRMSPEETAALEAELVARIVKIDDLHYRVTRSPRFHTAFTELLRQVRIVPEQKGGRTVGIRLFGIRPGGLAAALGFREGDRVEKVDDIAIDHPVGALDAYAKARKAERLIVSISRRGQPLTLHYEITD
jgi:type II secretory pathway component PulC